MLCYPQMKWALSDDTLRSQPEIKKLMPYDKFGLMAKHFRMVKQSVLPSKQSNNYNPLQNINEGVQHLRQKSLEMWSVGTKLCIDEGCIRSKSKRNQFKIRNPDKPIKMGWTVCKIADKGQFGYTFVSNHIVKVGKKTYANPQNGKNYHLVDQLLNGFKFRGRLVVMDNGYPTIKLLKDAKEQWNTTIIATQRGNTAHMRRNHKANISKVKSFVRGFSNSLHNNSLTVTTGIIITWLPSLTMEYLLAGNFGSR